MSLAVAKRPIFPGDFDQIDEQVLWSEAGRFREDFRHAFVKGAFLLRLAAGAHGDLHEDDAFRTGDAEVGWVVDQIAGRVFGDDLEAVAGWDGDGLSQRAMDTVGERLAIVGRGALAKGNANERHARPPVGFDAGGLRDGTWEPSWRGVGLAMRCK